MPPDFHFGGVVESGSKLFENLKNQNSKWCFLTTSKKPNGINRKYRDGISCKSYFFHRFGFSPYFVLKAYHSIKKTDFVFVNGTVTFPTVVSQIISICLKKPFGVSLRGACEEWRINHKKWKKFIYYKLIVIPLLRKADFIQVTSKEEKKSAERIGLKEIHIVTNGVEVDKFKQYPKTPNDCYIFLFLSRTDKEKGIDILLPAFKMLKEKHNNRNLKLKIVGPDNQNYLKNNFFPLDDDIIYISGLYGEDKIKIYNEANFFVLPSYSENFGNVIAESLICGTPVITTTGTPWIEIKDYNCGYYINPNENELMSAMEKAISLTIEEYSEMVKNGIKLIKEKYQWDQKAKELQAIIQDCILK